MAPLTHHDILRLIGPFTARGRHVDLGRSAREERKMAFKSIEHPGAAEGDAITEQLELYHPGPERFRLTRTLTAPGAPEAEFVVDAATPQGALERIEAVAPASQFTFGLGYTIARSLRQSPDGPATPVLTRAIARVGSLMVTLIAPTVARMPADLRLSAPAGDVPELPIDLLAVQGGSWAPIYPREQEWRGTVRVRRREPARSVDCAARLETAARHIAGVLAETPARFHERFTRQRWLVAVRLGMPLLIAIALFAGAFMLPIIDIPRESIVWMLIFNSPPLLMLLVFSMREIPRIAVPPMPRASSAAAWTTMTSHPPPGSQSLVSAPLSTAPRPTLR